MNNFTYEVWFKKQGTLESKTYQASNKEEARAAFIADSDERIIDVVLTIDMNVRSYSNY